MLPGLSHRALFRTCGVLAVDSACASESGYIVALYLDPTCTTDTIESLRRDPKMLSMELIHAAFHWVFGY